MRERNKTIPYTYSDFLPIGLTLSLPFGIGKSACHVIDCVVYMYMYMFGYIWLKRMYAIVFCVVLFSWMMHMYAFSGYWPKYRYRVEQYFFFIFLFLLFLLVIISRSCIIS